MTTSKERVLQREHDRGRPVGKLQGKADALDLAARAPQMDGTAIIAEEEKVPAWSKNAVYTSAQVGYPVQDNGQVYTIQTPHTPAHNPGSRPADLRAIYSLLHTTDPAKAKPWMPSYGTSGLYMQGECCTYEHPIDGLLHINCCLVDYNEFPPYTLNAEDSWEDLGPVPGQTLPEPEETVPEDEGKSSSGLLTQD